MSLTKSCSEAAFLIFPPSPYGWGLGCQKGAATTQHTRNHRAPALTTEAWQTTERSTCTVKTRSGFTPHSPLPQQQAECLTFKTPGVYDKRFQQSCKNRILLPRKPKMCTCIRAVGQVKIRFTEKYELNPPTSAMPWGIFSVISKERCWEEFPTRLNCQILRPESRQGPGSIEH